VEEQVSKSKGKNTNKSTNNKKIKFDKKSVRKLDDGQLENAAGGVACPSRFFCCPTKDL
jgi:hypothetical protein